MAVLPIVLYPHEALTTPAKPVEVFDAELHRFIDDMAETMYAAGGVGLAANQVAALRRVTVIDIAEDGKPPVLLEIINPTVVEKSGSIIWDEGCLSFPELFVDVKRASKVRVEYVDRHGAPKSIEGEGLLAVALQHEIDHLDGVCFIDRVSPLDRRLALRRFRKLMDQREKKGAND
jgi:peptide deformylase